MKVQLNSGVAIDGTQGFESLAWLFHVNEPKRQAGTNLPGAGAGMGGCFPNPHGVQKTEWRGGLQRGFGNGRSFGC